MSLGSGGGGGLHEIFGLVPVTAQEVRDPEQLTGLRRGELAELAELSLRRSPVRGLPPADRAAGVCPDTAALSHRRSSTDVTLTEMSSVETPRGTDK